MHKLVLASLIVWLQKFNFLMQLIHHQPIGKKMYLVITNMAAKLVISVVKHPERLLLLGMLLQVIVSFFIDLFSFAFGNKAKTLVVVCKWSCSTSMNWDTCKTIWTKWIIKFIAYTHMKSRQKSDLGSSSCKVQLKNYVLCTSSYSYCVQWVILWV